MHRAEPGNCRATLALLPDLRLTHPTIENACQVFAFKRIWAMQIIHYLAADNTDYYQEWLDGLRDLKARVTIQRRVDRLMSGNCGDHRFCKDGVWELRMDIGPGYRVYYARAGQTIVLLLCGGDKRTQEADLNRAVEYWQDYQRRLP